MHLDVVPSLRCPRPHEASGLVLVADATRGRHVISGVLGCPVCEAEYPIRSSAAYFVDAPPSTPAPPAPETLRTAAMLGLTEPGGVILLAGPWSTAANAMSELADALVLVLNPTAPAAYREGVSVIYAGERLPIAGRAIRAAAIAETVPRVIATLKPQGRLVATRDVPVPPEVMEIARDDEFWVGELTTTGPALALVRGPSRRDHMRERDEEDVKKKSSEGMPDTGHGRDSSQSGSPRQPQPPPQKKGSGMKDETDLDDR